MARRRAESDDSEAVIEVEDNSEQESEDNKETAAFATGNIPVAPTADTSDKKGKQETPIVKPAESTEESDKQAKVADTKLYRCKTTINHNQKQYQAGHSLKMSEEEAKPLIVIGAIEQI
jgi:hypothetical protein